MPGSVTLVSGEPGVGKSTLLLQAAAGVAAGGRVLYVSAEESPQQVRERAERLGLLSDGIWLSEATSVTDIVDQVAEVEPHVVIVDSIQTVSHPDISSATGSVTQVRESAQALVRMAKERGVVVVLVGHVTKDGSVAGPKTLEHLVDTVLSFDGDRAGSLRMLRAVKHRFGTIAELGVFDMTSEGLTSVGDPSAALLADRLPDISGAIVVPVLDGRRPLLVELQALVMSSQLPQPRRSAQGLDSGRLGLVLAVLDSRAQVRIAGHDVYAAAVGGLSIKEPAVDLPLALACASSFEGWALPSDTVACGEVGLGGEVRSVARLDHRLAEAKRHGFRRAIVPASATGAPDGLQVVRVRTVREALDAAADAGAAAAPSASPERDEGGLREGRLTSVS